MHCRKIRTQKQMEVMKDRLAPDERGMHLQHYAPKLGEKKELWRHDNQENE